MAFGILNELEVTGTSSPVAVNTGQALVYGIPYFNSASVNVAIPTPAAQTRIDRIVLRADWSAQTVRITRIAGTEGGSAPAMTQTPGTTWDIPLATVSITTGGDITVTDAREYVGGVADGVIVTAKLADDAVTAAKIADNAVNPRSHISGTNGIVIDPQNGDARGNDAVDLQTIRTSTNEVASGEASTIGGGQSNLASGAHSTVAGGQSNKASNQYSVVGGGVSNTASGQNSTIGGGSSHTNDGQYGVIGGGLVNRITDFAPYAWIGGGIDAKAKNWGQMAHAGGKFSTQGDAQRSVYIARNSTTNATPTELFLNGSSVRIDIPSDSTYAFRILLVARRTDADNESAAYEFVGCIANNAGTTALVGTVTKTVIAEDTAGWDAAVTADNTNDALVITVTGEAAKTIRWVATVWTTEVSG